MSKTNIELAGKIVSTMIESNYFGEPHTLTDPDNIKAIDDCLKIIYNYLQNAKYLENQHTAEVTVEMILPIIRNGKFSNNNICILFREYYSIIKDTTNS